MVRTRRQNSPLVVEHDEHSTQEPTPRAPNAAHLVQIRFTDPSTSGESSRQEPVIRVRSSEGEQTQRPRPPSPTRSTRSQRSNASMAARIKTAEYEALKRLTAIKMRILELEAELVQNKLEADIANIQDDDRTSRRGLEEVSTANVQIEESFQHGYHSQREPTYDSLSARGFRTFHLPAVPLAEARPERRDEEQRVSSLTKSDLSPNNHGQKRAYEMSRSTEDIVVFDTTKENRVPRPVYHQNRAPIKREAWSTAMSIFDPLGLRSHFTMTSKMIRLRLRGMNTWTSLAIRPKTMRRFHLLQQVIPQELMWYKHLQDLDPSEVCDQQARPRMLISSDNWELIVSKQLLTGRRNEPAASRTELGWVIHGTAPQDTINYKEQVLHLSAENYCNTRGARSVEHHLSYEDCLLRPSRKPGVTNESEPANQPLRALGNPPKRSFNAARFTECIGESDFRTLLLWAQPASTKSARQRGRVTLDPAYLYLKRKRNKETRSGGFYRTIKKLAVVPMIKKLRESFAEGRMLRTGASCHPPRRQ